METVLSCCRGLWVFTGNYRDMILVHESEGQFRCFNSPSWLFINNYAHIQLLGCLLLHLPSLFPIKCYRIFVARKRTKLFLATYSRGLKGSQVSSFCLSFQIFPEFVAIVLLDKQLRFGAMHDPGYQTCTDCYPHPYFLFNYWRGCFCC